MKFVEILSRIVAVSTIIGYVCASEPDAIVFDLGADLCGNGKFGCKYVKGYNGKSGCFNSADQLAKNLSDISFGKMSASRGYVEYMQGSSSYKINGSSGNPLLFGLNGVENDGTVDKIVFNSSKKPMCAVQLGFDRASDLAFPPVECYNVPLFKVNINDYNAGGYIKSFKTNTRTGLSYNVPIQIDGVQCNNAGKDLCMIANNGTNNIRYLDIGAGRCALGNSYEGLRYFNDTAAKFNMHVSNIRTSNVVESDSLKTNGNDIYNSIYRMHTGEDTDNIPVSKLCLDLSTNKFVKNNAGLVTGLLDPGEDLKKSKYLIVEFEPD